jgi:DNA-binding FrmR family transcriptional regulator
MVLGARVFQKKDGSFPRLLGGPCIRRRTQHVASIAHIREISALEISIADFACRKRVNEVGPDDPVLHRNILSPGMVKSAGTFNLGALMAHTVRDKKRLLNRVRRIRGQIDAIAKALEEEQDCSDLLRTIAACRGAINGLMGEVIEGHIRFHVVNPDTKPTSDQAKGAQQLMDVVKTYLR